MTIRNGLRFSWTVGLWLSASLALAQVPPAPPTGDKELAREWANKANDRFQAGDYQGAIQAMTEAQKHARPPTFTRFLAQAHEKLGKLVEAERLYREVAEMALGADPQPAWVKAQEEARQDLAVLTPRIPKVQITVSGAGAEGAIVTLDGKPLDAALLGKPVALDPGKHGITVEAKGRNTVSREVVLKEGATEQVSIDLVSSTPVPTPSTSVSVSPAPSATPGSGPSPAAIGGYVALGVGGLGLVLGAITGGLAVVKRDEAAAACGADFEAGRCRADNAGPLADGQVLARASTAGFVIAGVGAAAGTLLLLLPSKKAPQVGVAVGPGSLLVKGAF